MQPLGMFAWFGYQLPLAERLQLIFQAGFTTTCLWVGDEEELYAAGLGDRMPALAKEAGLSVDNIHAPFDDCNTLWSGSKKAISAVTQKYLTALAFCRKHNIPNLVVHVTRGSTPPPPTSSGLCAVKELVSLAEEFGVVLAIENTRSLNHLDFLLSNIESPNLGFCYDSSHDFITGQSRGEVLRKWGHRLVTTHLSDNNGIDDDHYLPGDGFIDWQMVHDIFPRSSYAGALMLEVLLKDHRSMPPEEFVKTAHDRAIQLESSLGQQRAGADAEKSAVFREGLGNTSYGGGAAQPSRSPLKE